MDFDDWEPVYEAILADFGFDRTADEAARDELAELVGTRRFDLDRLAHLDGTTVVVAGSGPSLTDGLSRVDANDAIVAASTATDRVLAAGLGIDCMVTDLDKNFETPRRLTKQGVPVAVHAHGDNRSLVREAVPTFAPENVLPTTQAAPRSGVWHFGGFTDGDRAAFLADAFGAEGLHFVGWDFDDPTVTPTKRRKLDWGERLLYWLERRRDERFGVLDDRREGIDTRALPIE